MLKKLLSKIGTKGVFNTVFPKAENSKIGRLASGIVNGAAQATPLSFFQEFAKGFFDTNKDGEITVDDFKGMDIKTFGMAIGFLVVFGLLISFVFGGL
tara:strand:- start:24614 stop:24907 length:294 start_codon:yes stop_codon:yes gene_type:complete